MTAKRRRGLTMANGSIWLCNALATSFGKCLRREAIPFKLPRTAGFGPKKARTESLCIIFETEQYGDTIWSTEQKDISPTPPLPVRTGTFAEAMSVLPIG